MFVGFPVSFDAGVRALSICGRTRLWRHRFTRHFVYSVRYSVVEWKRNVMAHAQKPDLVFQRNGQVHLYRRGCQFSLLLAAEVCASAVVMLDRPCSDTVHECWLPTPFASFPFTSPPMLRRVPSDSVSTLPINSSLSTHHHITRLLQHSFITTQNIQSLSWRCNGIRLSLHKLWSHSFPFKVSVNYKYLLKLKKR